MERQEAHRNYYYYYYYCSSSSSFYYYYYNAPEKKGEKNSSTHAQVKTTRVESGTKPGKRITPKGLQEIPVHKQKPKKKKDSRGGSQNWRERTSRAREMKKEVRVTTGSSNGAT
jgi:hypothetical protein